MTTTGHSKDDAKISRLIVVAVVFRGNMINFAEIRRYQNRVIQLFYLNHRSVTQAFFWTVRKKLKAKKLKTQGKNSKLKPKAQKVGTF